MKRVADGPPPGDRGGGGKQPRTSRYGQYAFKALCPEALVAKMMADGWIHQVEDRTGTHLQFSTRNTYFPGTRLRILTIVGQEPAAVGQALSVVLGQCLEIASEERSGGSPDFVEKGQPVFRVILSKLAAGAVIGPKGDRVKKIRETSGAHVHIAREVVDGNQLVTVGGTSDQITAVLDELNEIVQGDAGEGWFAEWAAQRSINQGGGGGGGGHGQERERGGGGHGQERGGGGHGSRPDTIFVGRLSQSTSSDSLAVYFERFGRVKEADVKTDTATGRSKGFGFVTFVDPASVDACTASREEHVIDDRRVDVKRYGDGGGDEGGHGGGADRGHSGSAHRGGSIPAWSGGGGDRRGERGERGERGGDRGGGGGGSGASGGRTRQHEAVPWLCGMADQVNPEYLELAYCISFSLPSSKCGAVIGRGGETKGEVQRITGAEVAISKKEPHEGVDAHRTITITGPLLSVYAAHMLLMRHYNDEEKQFEASQQRPPPPDDRRAAGGGGGRHNSAGFGGGGGGAGGGGGGRHQSSGGGFGGAGGGGDRRGGQFGGASGGGHTGSGGGKGGGRIEDLERKLAELSQELSRVRGGSGGSGGGAPARGGGGPRVPAAPPPRRR